MNDANLPNLAPETEKFYRRTVAAFDLDPDERRLLLLACENWDRGEAARVAVAASGFTHRDRFGQPRLVPEYRVMVDAERAFAGLLQQLNLRGPGRPLPIEESEVDDAES